MKNSKKPINPIRQTEEWYEKNNPKELIGLTKREYFAGLAMQGMLADESGGQGLSYTTEKCITRAIEFADELLKQLEK